MINFCILSETRIPYVCPHNPTSQHSDIPTLHPVDQLIDIYQTRRGRSRLSQLPPGPFRIPIFGYMPFMASNPQNALKKLAQRYGNVFTIYLGNYRVVVLNDYKTIKDAFKEDNFSGRPNLKMLEVRNQGVRRGLVCSEGREWSEQRKFTLRQLKDLGLGKQSMDCLVHDEIDELVVGLKRDKLKSVNLQHRITTAVLNVIWRITCGERYTHDDYRMQILLEKTRADLAETQYTGPLLFLPWLINLAPRLTRWKEFVKSVDDVHSFLANIIKSHKTTFNSQIRRDFIDSYLAEVQRITDPESSFYKSIGGADTTSTTLYWAFLYMVLYRDVQGKVQIEIDEIIGNETACAEHRKKMPYTEATMMEIMRKSSLVPLGLFHNTMSDTEFAGYYIPKETVIAANLHIVHNSEKIWGDPQNFRPSRFLDANNRIKKYDEFIPFSIGKRVCPGENLARDEFFLFFVGLLKHFSFYADPDKPSPSEVPNIGVILSPKPYFVKAQVRKN
ncbi:unnamed protein product [Allacma fusca]|uniref:Cytochrome P450 n=1 Tax=Allacma fusca TaxID=39272 RepID=A0A8J2P951_9HEXA|nr:unnamed protein product [Allacma fusca]